MSLITKTKRTSVTLAAVAALAFAGLGTTAANAAEVSTNNAAPQSATFYLTKSSTVVDRTGSSKAVRAAIANGGYVYYGPWKTGRSAVYLNTTSGYKFNRVGDQPTSSTGSRYYVDYYLR